MFAAAARFVTSNGSTVRLLALAFINTYSQITSKGGSFASVPAVAVVRSAVKTRWGLRRLCRLRPQTPFVAKHCCRSQRAVTALQHSEGEGFPPSPPDHPFPLHFLGG